LRFKQGFALLILLCATCLATERVRTSPVEYADLIVIEKSTRTMRLLHADKVLKTYKVALSREPVGAKQREGDHKVPEGKYVIDEKIPAVDSIGPSTFHILMPRTSSEHASSEPNPAAISKFMVSVASSNGWAVCTDRWIGRMAASQ
jgi:hypothetical protein